MAALARLQTVGESARKGLEVAPLPLPSTWTKARKIDLLVGHDFGKPIASRQSGSLTIADSAEAVTFEATLPEEASDAFLGNWTSRRPSPTSTMVGL